MSLIDIRPMKHAALGPRKLSGEAKILFADPGFLTGQKDCSERPDPSGFKIFQTMPEGERPNMQKYLEPDKFLLFSLDSASEINQKNFTHH